MWGNLGDKLGAQDWKGTLQKIGNAVAPPPGDSDEEYEEYSDEEYEDEEQYENEEEAESQNPFGLVGMLARALDQPPVAGNDDGGEDVNSPNAPSFDDQVMVNSDMGKGVVPEDPDAPSRPKVDDWGDDSDDENMVGTTKTTRNFPAERFQANTLSATKMTEPASAAAPTNSFEHKKVVPPNRSKAKAQAHAKAPTPPPVASRPDPSPVPTVSRVRRIPSSGPENGLGSEPKLASATPNNSTRAARPSMSPSPKAHDGPSGTTRSISKAQQITPPSKYAGTAKPLNAMTIKSVQDATSVAMIGIKPLPVSKAIGNPRQEDVGIVSENLTDAAKVTADLDRKADPTHDMVNRQLLLENPETTTSCSTSLDEKSTMQKLAAPVGNDSPPQRAEATSTKPTLLEDMSIFNTSNAPAAKNQSHMAQPTISEHQVNAKSQTNQNIALPTTQKAGAKAEIEGDNLQALSITEEKIMALQEQLRQEAERADAGRESMMMEFQAKEARLLHASAEEYQHEMLQAEHRHQAELQSLEQRLAEERTQSVQGNHSLKDQIEKSTARAERAEEELQRALQQHQGEIAQASQQESRSLRKTEDKVAQSLALLDERSDEIARLKKLVKDLKSSMNEHAEGAEEAEQEVDELQTENEGLQENMDALEAECAELKAKISNLVGDTTRLGELQMELTMLSEERDRERAKNQSMVQSTMSSRTQVEMERDVALAEVRDLKQQLTANQADFGIIQADKERILNANNNLQTALEAFQDERQAEMDMIDEQRMTAEAAIQSAHATAMEIAQHTHSEELERVKLSAASDIHTAKAETSDQKVAMMKLKSENGHMRRSLDEAIHRLQTTQEDVIDRTLMKNILLDWCTMKDKDKRQQVLQLMASVLHFTEDEKEKVHLTHIDVESVRAKVVGALAAPLPPSKMDMGQLHGDNVSEKWINFLLAETDD